MERRATLFKDDTLRGISLAIKNLQHQEAEAKLSNENSVHVITKLNPHFRNLINYLDLAFSFCLKDEKRGYWPFVKRLAHSSVVHMVEKHRMAENDIKKGYIWLFLTFIEDSLESYLRLLVQEKKYLKQFYSNLSLLRDKERLEILFNFLAGLEQLTFSLDFENPYLDYGHDPVLRQEKIIIRVQAPKIDQTDFESTIQPDVTMTAKKPQKTNVPDLLPVSRKDVSRSPYRNSLSYSEEDHIAVHVTSKKSPNKKRTVSEGDSYTAHEESIEEPVELEDDNFIPEILGSPEYTVCVPDEPRILLQTSDPMMKTFSQDDVNYQHFLNDYRHEQQDEYDSNVSLTKVKINSQKSNDDNCSYKEVEDSFEGAENTFKTLNLKDNEGYQFTYVSDNEADIDENKHEFDDAEDSEDFHIYRTDSFDKFCRRSSFDETTADEQGELAEHDVSTPAVAVAPKISQESIKGSISPVNLSRISIEKLNSARLDTKSGILLPLLPRRPDIKEALKLMPEIMLDQNSKVMISLEIFQSPEETVIQMYEVFVGYLAGIGFPMYLLVSNLSIYLLKKRETVQSGFISILSIPIDNINKLQTGLNYQDVFVFYESGCIHISTSDETTTRSLIGSVRSVIKSNSMAPQASDIVQYIGEELEPIAPNTHNELDLVLKDWLLCHTQTEEPELIHFSLVNFTILSSNDPDSGVVKAGNLYYKQSSILNVVTASAWTSSYFTLWGAVLYEYSSKKKTDLKATYDLSTKCGGCVRSGEKNGFHTFQILESDGSTCMLELGCHDENDANDWLLNICQVVADAKNGEESSGIEPQPLSKVGLFLTSDKLYVFTQEPKSGRLTILRSFSVLEVTQVCVDHDDRTFCCLIIDGHLKDSITTNKTVWFVKFHSEYELGKFEKRLFDAWHILYKVPLQFVLLSDEWIRNKIHYVTSSMTSFQRDDLGREEIAFLVNTC